MLFLPNGEEFCDKNKMTLQIIYTPEADKFCLGEIDRIGRRTRGDSVLDNLRGNYSRLRKRVSNLPETVGVVSYNLWFKKEAERIREEADNKSTTYLPLAILEQLVELSKLDLKNPMDANYFYRAFSRIIAHPAILNDKSLAYSAPIIFGSSIPAYDGVRERYTKLLSTLKDDSNPENTNAGLITPHLEELLEVMERFPRLSDLEEVRKKVEVKFKRNKVSREFPLCYLPDAYFPSFTTVSLTEGIQTPDFVEGMIRYIKLGCEAQGKTEIPPEVQKEIDSWSSDKFGETKLVFSLDELLGSLPERKTIITDTYIVDINPQLMELGFESIEINQ